MSETTTGDLPDELPDDIDTSEEFVDPADITPISNPSGNIPKYIRQGLEKQDEQSLRDIIAYSLHLIEELNEPVEEEELVESREGIEDYERIADSNVWSVTRKIMCNKENCRCHTKGDLHGPYNYYVYRQGGTLKWEYRGKA